jgi:hypothetical protein
MKESPEEFRDRLHRDALQKVNKMLESNRKELSSILRDFGKENIADVVHAMPDLNLKEYFTIAQEQEDFEVCEAIKQEMGKRGINK